VGNGNLAPAGPVTLVRPDPATRRPLAHSLVLSQLPLKAARCAGRPTVPASLEPIHRASSAKAADSSAPSQVY